MKVILASKSPRRQELLKQIFNKFEIKVADIDETFIKNTPEENVMDVAFKKANAFNDKNALIISSDTTVYMSGKYYNKPYDKNDAFKMLKELSNKTHFVYTGVCCKLNNNIIKFYDVAEVKFKNMSDDYIINYIEEANPLDKAGAYGIQDDIVVECFKGDYYTIMGLPVDMLKEKLKELL